MLEIKYKKLSIKRQCKLLPLNRPGVFYKETNNEALMRKIDEIYTNFHFYGYKCIRATLKRKEHLVNSKRVFRLMKQMDPMVIFPKPNLSKANEYGTQDFSILATRKDD